ncbi:hypothetical protein BG004_003745 [Podila humilis]|nr:hypothetical protein BG004_003745 [Podila humilis]
MNFRHDEQRPGSKQQQPLGLLLQFSTIAFHVLTLDGCSESQTYTIKVSARIDRGFFLASKDWTCYRRNYFQLSASFSFEQVDSMQHAEPPCLLDHNGELVRVRSFMICIGAQIQNGEKIIELVQHTPKRDKGPQMTPQPTRVRAGGDPSISSSNMNPNVITFERVQFKTATANNGKRRAAQQYYQVHVDLFAELDGGELVLVASAFSAPLVVRGRSPGHYADNDDSHLSVASHAMDIGRHSYGRIDSIGGSAAPLSPGSGNVYPHFGNYSYSSSYPYQSLGSASHIASQGHDGGYYDRQDESYPSSPISPLGAHQGTSASPDLGSPPGFSGPTSPSTFPRLPHLHSHVGSHYPYGSPYAQTSQSYRSESQFDPDHETQMAGLRIHSPTSPRLGSANAVAMSAPSSPSGTSRRQSFSTSLLSSKKSERGVGATSNNTRKSRSISLSGTVASNRSTSKPRSIRTVPPTPTKKDFGRISGGSVNGGTGVGLVGIGMPYSNTNAHNNGHGHSNSNSHGHGGHGLGFSKDRIPESLMEDSNAV